MVGPERSNLVGQTGNGSMMSSGLPDNVASRTTMNRPIGGGPASTDAVINEDDEPRGLDPNWHIGSDVSSGRRAPQVIVDPVTHRTETYRLSAPTPR